ncbi:MAG TPA: hypothetical protein VET26_11310 [Candidatus Sulfotelmatobacter sp.]|nr:hypothetical protein [Candidatus Sulfotelmatobacter sp.]
MSGKRERPEIPTPPDRLDKHQQRQPGDPDHKKPASTQGPNVGYWQAVGSTRAAAKRSKRP